MRLYKDNLNIAEEYIFQESIYQTFVRSMPVPVIMFDKDLRFIIASNRFFEESPLTKDHIKPGDHWYTIVPDMPQKWKLIHHRCLQGEHLKCDEDTFLRHDGVLEWWRWEILPWRTQSGEIGGIMLYVENITQEKQYTHDLKRTLRLLNRSNNELSTFVQKCAHDLNAPLRAISSCVQIIQDSMNSPGENPLKKHCSSVVENAEYMSSLISRILENALSNNKTLKCHYVSMAEIVERVVFNMNEAIQMKKAVIRYSSLPVVYADKTCLIQVMQNLISNALKYTRDSAPKVDIAFKDNGIIWIFLVRDNGMGIERKNLKKIFCEYKRLNSQASYKGLGIGLHQCNRIIKEHGGKMWARSIPNQGSTFLFTLPKINEL